MKVRRLSAALLAVLSVLLIQTPALAEWSFDATPPTVVVTIPDKQSDGTTPNPANDLLYMTLTAADNWALPVQPKTYISISTTDVANPPVTASTPACGTSINGPQVCYVSGAASTATFQHNPASGNTVYYIKARVDQDVAGNNGTWSTSIAIYPPPIPVITQRSPTSGTYTTTITWTGTNWYNNTRTTGNLHGPGFLC